MMRGVASTLEKHHKVQILDEALEAAVRLSHRYIPARQLPDKSVSLLDTACARVAISQHADAGRSGGQPQAHRGAGDRAGDHRPREARSASTPASARAERERAAGARTRRLAELEARWNDGARAGRRRCWRCARSCATARSRSKAPAASSKRRRGRRSAEAPLPTMTQRADLLAELKDVQAKLAALQGETPLILPTVDDQAVAAVVARLDRHPGRPHGQERDRDRAEAGRRC